MIVMNFPEPSFSVKQVNGRDMILDLLRKKWLPLTPEEWVRQNFIQSLIQIHDYPSSLIAMEKEIQLGELKKRFDILVYDNEHKPWMIIECKAGRIALNDSVLQQALRYNISVPVPFIVITNGNFTVGWQKKDDRIELIETMPAWKR